MAMRTGDRLICSTEDSEIADEAKRCGAEVPFTRPMELATDVASSASVIEHALAQVGDGYDRVMLLEPSSPFTSVGDYIAADEMMISGVDAVIGMRKVEPHSTFVGPVSADRDMGEIISKMRGVAGWRRQDFIDEWTANGALYLFSTEMFARTGSVYGGSKTLGLLMPRWRGIEIDTMDDLLLAEFAYERGLVSAPSLPLPLSWRWRDAVVTDSELRAAKVLNDGFKNRGE